MPIFIKQDGREIEINGHPANIAKAKELGWQLKGEEAEKPKRKRRTKAEMEAAKEAD